MTQSDRSNARLVDQEMIDFLEQQQREINALMGDLKQQAPQMSRAAHDKRDPLIACYGGYMLAINAALAVARNGAPPKPDPAPVSVLLTPCGRTIGTTAPMPDGVTVCACGSVHPRQVLAETAAPWLVAA